MDWDHGYASSSNAFTDITSLMYGGDDASDCATSGLQNRCSPFELHPHNHKLIYTFFIGGLSLY
jgi:hypothetical protein